MPAPQFSTEGAVAFHPWGIEAIELQSITLGDIGAQQRSEQGDWLGRGKIHGQNVHQDKWGYFSPFRL